MYGFPELDKIKKGIDRKSIDEKRFLFPNVAATLFISKLLNKEDISVICENPSRNETNKNTGTAFIIVFIEISLALNNNSVVKKNKYSIRNLLKK